MRSLLILRAATLEWFTGNIAVHHVHRRIPLYGLSQVPKDHPERASAGWLTFFQSLRRTTLALLDDDLKRLTLFCEPLQRNFVLGW